MRYDRQGVHSTFNDAFASFPAEFKRETVISKAGAWNQATDKLQFGIFAGNPDLDLPDFTASSDEEILEIFNSGFALKDTLNWKQVFGNNFSKAWCKRYEINELLALVSPMYRPMGSLHHRVILPGYAGSIFLFEVGRNVYRAMIGRRLKAKPSDYMKELAQMIAPTEELGPNFQVIMTMDNKVQALDTYHRIYDRTTMYFRHLQSLVKAPSFSIYFDLHRAHFTISPLASIESRAKCKGKNAQTPRDDNLNTDKHRWRSEQVNMLFDKIPNIDLFMENEGYQHEPSINPKMLEEAWITLVLRGLCWSTLNPRSQENKGGDLLPSRYYGSHIPVFLSSTYPSALPIIGEHTLQRYTDNSALDFNTGLFQLSIQGRHQA